MSNVQTPVCTYTIDELARLGGSTVRNVRAYQERGILPPPTRQGRVGIYDDNHLARLRIISQLLGRGYSISNISEMLQAFEQGQQLSQLIGLDTALTSDWVHELSTEHTLDELIARLPVQPSAHDIQRAFDLGILEPIKGDIVRLNRPYLLQLAIPFLDKGISLSRMLDVMAEMLPHMQEMTGSFSRVAIELIFQANASDQANPKHHDDMLKLIWDIRPLVSNMLEKEILRALSGALRQHMTTEVVNQLLNPK